jgi:hypothetical protein
MNKEYRFPSLLFSMILIVSVLTSCSPAKPAPTPTATLVPPPTATATATKRPTSTPRPTATPNLAKTQAYNDLYDQLKVYKDAGNISTLDGEYATLEDFNENWAQMNWYQWWTQNRYVTNFVFNGHFSWSTASETPELSGCGIVFDIQPNYDHYAVFLDKARILFLHAVSTSQYSHEVGKTRGTGRVNISSPYNADFTLIVNSYHAYIYVDNKFVGEYTLSTDSKFNGQIGYSLNSGTNKDYGTKCEITDARLWTFK